MKPFEDYQKPIKQGKRFLGFLGDSYRDYLAARILFNNNQLIQACCLANTSIEKFLKALIDSEGNKPKFTHNLIDLLSKIEKYNLEELNADFLNVITKIYSSRYIGDCDTGYNMVIVKNKFLAELDYVYSILEPKLRLLKTDTKQVANSRYEIDLSMQNSALLMNNYILLGINKTTFIEQLDFVSELRMHNHSVMEVTYSTNESKNDAIFDFESLKPNGNENRSFKTCYRADSVKEDLVFIINGHYLNRGNYLSRKPR
ncbi:hypothetical protein GCM10023314_16540 [Algibacter agarivorans]|uniref:HEPN domain-containing protein n=1 Tax=Algibacter agarivorans TaxID=1109741 RepID=A0ABP9GRC8_9FLAO